MLTDVKTALMLRILSTTRAAVTIGLVTAFLLMVAFCIDCSRISSLHDISGEMDMEMYLGEDEGDNSHETNVLSSAIEYESCGSYYWSSHCIFVDGSLLH